MAMIIEYSQYMYLAINQYLNKALRFSGSSVRPAYPGFIVMKRPTVGVRRISVPSNKNLSLFILMASWILFT